MSRRSTPPPIPQGYRLIRRHHTADVSSRPADLHYSPYGREPVWQPWSGAGIPGRNSYTRDVFIRPIDARKQREPAACACCHRSSYRQGMGYPGESANVPVKLREVSAGRLVCSRCVGQSKGSVTRHFNIVTRLGGRPTYNGQRITATEAALQHVQNTLA